MKFPSVLAFHLLCSLTVAAALPQTPTATPTSSALTASDTSPSTITPTTTPAASNTGSTVTTTQPATSTYSYTDGDPTAGPGNAIDNSDGGSGGGDAWALSKGGIIAIGVCVGLVAAFGVASTALWYVAKKRRWDVRRSLKRVSRRLTGRKDRGEEERLEARKSRRRGLVTIGEKDELVRQVDRMKGKQGVGKTTEIEMMDGKKKRFGS